MKQGMPVKELIQSELIYQKANDIIRQCKTKDMFLVATALGIRITCGSVK